MQISGARGSFTTRGRNVCLIIAALLASSAANVVAYAQPTEKTLPRFSEINENLYRSAQPLTRGIERLVELGIKTVINLRGEDEDSRSEEATARASGVRYFNVPLSDLSAPSDEQVEKVLALINDSRNWPVLVHCQHGKDRTGTIIAIYRFSQDGWTSKEAKAEAKRMGMSWVQIGMKSYISDYGDKYRAALKRPR